MATTLSGPEATLELYRLAWGEQSGYVGMALRDPSLDPKDQGYWKDMMFRWPDDSSKILTMIERARHARKDLYWAPAVFTKPRRSIDNIAPVSTLWADLDEADPHLLPKSLKPTAVWETSPGRWQAIWQLSQAVDPRVQTELNRRLTYAIGADKGGWDLTQVLRTPGTPNNKYPERPNVKLLYINGHILDPVRLADDLPDLGPTNTDAIVSAELPDVSEVIKEYKSTFNARIKELLRARHAQVGTRSDRLWELECLLAERGMKLEEIVSVIRPTVWNKFEGRTDEVGRLLTEAAKAIEHVGSVAHKVIDDALEEVNDTGPQTWREFDSEHRPIRWLVADVWGESEVGFISGLPKSYKSWLALDLAISVATGTRFLDSFQCRKHNVLLIQEEDPKPVLQDRMVKIGAAKELVWVRVDESTPGRFSMRYDLPDNLHIISNQGFTIDDVWLDQLEAWILERDIRLCILDPLMMIASGNFDEFKAFEFMEKVLKPLKRVRARTGTAIVLVHHHMKAGGDGARAMYGSVALWAWEEAALHLQIGGPGRVVAERFSKHALLAPLNIEIGDVSDTWSPIVGQGTQQPGTILDLLSTMEAGATVEELEDITGMARSTLLKQLRTHEERGEIEAVNGPSTGRGRPKKLWRRAGT